MKVLGQGTVTVGQKCSIAEDLVVIFKSQANLDIGDYVVIGESTKIVIEAGNVSIGDWTTIHGNTLMLSKVGLEIGQHCWVGQNSILDGTGGLYIKNGVRVGMYSQIWTHVAAGELIEGCKLFSARPTVIMNDVWLVGSCTVSSGITIGEKVICMNGSNVTKSILANTVALGSPAVVREGLSFYRTPSIDSKYNLMCEWVAEFCCIAGLSHFINDGKTIEINGDIKIIIHLYHDDFLNNLSIENVVNFCIESKLYEKKYTELEEKLIRFLGSNKARFYPYLFSEIAEGI